MLQNKTYLLIFLLLITGKFIVAQSDSIAAVKYPTRYYTEFEMDRNLKWHFIDTVIKKDENYQPLYKKYGIYQDLGNVGTPGTNLFFNPNRANDFNLGFNPYKIYFKNPQETRYYNTRIPYADLSYTQGIMELLMLNVKFSVNVTPRLNIGVDYDRVTSLGFYPRQYTSGYFTNIFSSYQSKNMRYGLLSNLNFNRGVLDESGGIRSDSLFETLRGTNKAISVVLENSQSRYKNMSFYARQYFYLGKSNRIIRGDDTSYMLSQTGFVSHTLRYDHDRFFFDNPAGDTSVVLFPNKNFDTLNVFYDSIYSKTLMNRFAYAYWTKSNERQQSFIEFAIAYKYIEVHQYDLTNTYHNIWGEANMERIAKTQNNLGLKLHGSYCMSGYNQNDFKASGELKLLTPIFDVTGGISNQLYTPDYTQVYYRSNPLVWNNRFSKIVVNNWRAGIVTRGFRNNFKLHFTQYIISNWVYNSLTVNPVQSNQLLLVHTLEAEKTFQAWLFFFDNRLIYQKANLDIMRLPEFSAILRYYLKASLFKKALLFEIGGELFYNTAFYGNAYHPSARVFYLQNQKEIGNYPMVNAFITGQIKKAIIFAKYEHVNMDYKNTGFYYTPGYPLPIRAFRIGIRWRMYN